jgi:hypothetical protein
MPPVLVNIDFGGGRPPPEVPYICCWLRSRSAAAFVDEFQRQLAINALADVHGK